MNRFWKDNRNIALALFLAFFIVRNSSALNMQFIVTMPPVITGGTITQFDVFGSGLGAQIFTLILDNIKDNTSYTGLTLRYRVHYYQQSGGGRKLLYEGISNQFSMLPNEYVPPISSKDFLKKNNPLVKVSLRTTIFELSDTDPLKQQFLSTQKIPDGKVRYTMTLEHNGSPYTEQYSEHAVINTSKVELVTPGAQATDLIQTIFNPNPVFIWNSDLPPNIYGNDDVFEVRIYKANTGESAAQALSRVPVVKAGTKTLQYKLPDEGYRLIPGATYYWEVIGFVKGISTSEIKSSPFGFKMTKPVNPKVQEVINTIKPIYDESILEKIYEYDSDVVIKIDGHEKDVNELRELVQKILTEESSIQYTTVE